ncbi:MAG: ABC transporter ATP-binding protein [Gemmatimonadaceae bacterium]|jgi:ABC-2 type transport system ATP-binding protein|nr:ABC transporter ATP-binding protein [Gemmatimonadaceae bacterium]
MIQLAGATKRYGSFTAVDALDLEIPPGEVFGFLGANGAGKTTTLKMMSGILRPDRGTVRVAGHDMARDPVQAKRQLAFVPDRPYVYDKLTGHEFLRFTAALYGLEWRAARPRAQELLELFELEAWEHELVEQYSHGMRQKLLLTAAVLHRPKVLLVDEPLVGLDPRGARLLKDMLRAYAALGNAVIMSTHTLETVEATCDRIGIMRRGQLVACGTVPELRTWLRMPDAPLEQLFLHLAGEAAARDVHAVLRA